LKILQVVNFFSPVHGGSAEVPYQLSKELAKRGHEVTIYTSDYKLSEEWVKSCQELKIDVLSFRTWLNYANLLVTPGIYHRAKSEVARFDAVHMHSYRTFQNIVIHRYAMRYGIPYLLQAHGSLPRIIAKRYLKRIYDNIWGYRLLKDAAKVVALTKIEADQYRGMGVDEDRIKIIPNGIDVADFENLPERDIFRRRYGLYDNQIILYLGRIHQIKGLDLLVKAFTELLDHFGNAELVIAGPDDGYLPSLKKLIAALGLTDKVLFTGPLYGKEKLEAYVAADVYVLPSSYEIFGITVLEACACAIPVVVTDRCGIADFIDRQAGFSIPYDEHELRDAIFKILVNVELGRKLGIGGRQLVKERSGWDKITEKVERAYSTLTSGEEDTGEHTDY